MKINKDFFKGYHYMNELGVVVSNSESQGIGDSLGRTAIAAMIYHEDRDELLEAVLSYFQYCRTSPEAGWQWYVCRYPGEDSEDYLRGNSRDHVLYAISNLVLFEDDYDMEFTKNFVQARAKRPCIDHPYTPSQKIWFKAIHSKAWSWVYAIFRTPWLLLQALLIWILRSRLFSDTRKTWDSPSEFYHAGKKPLNKWQKLCYWAILPTYAAFYSIYAVNALPSKSAKKWLQVIFRLYFEKHNYVARALCGCKVTAPEVYYPSRKNRWTTRLDRGCDRDMNYYSSDTPETNMEMGMLQYFVLRNDLKSY